MFHSTSIKTATSHISRSAYTLVAGLAVAGATMAGAAPPVSAQSAPQSQPAQGANGSWEFVMASGALIPTGAQRSVIKNGKLSTAQVAYAIHPLLAVTSTVGWGRSREVASAGDNKFDAFIYDVGAEARLPRYTLGGSKTLSVFSGLGAGGRSLNYRNLDVDASHNISAYGSVGAELGVRRIRVRVEARDYITRFAGVDGLGTAKARNDVVVMAGLRVVKR